MAPRATIPVRRIPAGRLGLETGMTVVRVEQVKLKRAYFITIGLCHSYFLHCEFNVGNHAEVPNKLMVYALRVAERILDDPDNISNGMQAT